MTFKWQRDKDEVARLIPKKIVKGIFNKQIILSPNERAVLVKNGVVQETITDGKLSIGGLLNFRSIGKDIDIVLLDISPKDISWEKEELWTADSHKVNCKGILRLRIIDPTKTFKMLYGHMVAESDNGKSLSTKDIYTVFESELLSHVLEPEVRALNAQELYGNKDIQVKMESELEVKLKSTLSLWGLELLKYNLQWDLGTYEDIMHANQEFQVKEEIDELETLAVEGEAERTGRLNVARIRADQALSSEKNNFVRDQKYKDVRSQVGIEKMQFEADIQQAREAIALKEELKLAKTRGKRTELEVDQDMRDREHGRDLEYLSKLAEAGGPEVAKTVSEGRELSRMTAEQIEAIAKVKQSEVLARENKIEFMKEVEDRERMNSYRRQELDAAMMSAANSNDKYIISKKCYECGTRISSDARFCSQCGRTL
ncbi:hypothetical protein Mzhil_1285 [Methanosalsum zhilinae DSM 4017]|uniref:Uncharacterized protein n=1 Tax=Methanosalsum zhilinae (strain DSM 4017 / NBRC 107636 / OCM 62 / WeN5) TaxID=679901 RepID=F7XN27_METZD|nr:SPFH domain-containing protein [Methanosalsum zhilinae]AEH61139.1 hypothetical protein Mzhil_1285 [Methanosalsum zhilinae DSM 4017]